MVGDAIGVLHRNRSKDLVRPLSSSPYLCWNQWGSLRDDAPRNCFLLGPFRRTSAVLARLPPMKPVRRAPKHLLWNGRIHKRIAPSGRCEGSSAFRRFSGNPRPNPALAKAIQASGTTRGVRTIH
jgi:hypothetical protein